MDFYVVLRMGSSSDDDDNDYDSYGKMNRTRHGLLVIDLSYVFELCICYSICRCNIDKF